MITVSDFQKCKSFISVKGKIEKNINVSISTDTRDLSKKNFFLAIEGEKFNALSFLNKVEEAGCRYVIYSKSSENDLIIKEFLGRITFIETTNSIKFLQEITSVLSVKYQNSGGKLIAISGSNGKTTTKEMLYHLLKSMHKETICTQKNNNNHIGVPLTLLQINSKTKFAIVELGSNHPGEIKKLCEIIKPRIGITTNIGDTHLEFFESRENVFKEEAYLCKAILDNESKEKTLFVNSDDNYLKYFMDKPSVINLGISATDYMFVIEKEKVLVKNKGNEYSIINKFITGKHNFFNLCVAFSIAKEINSNNTRQYIQAVKTFKPTTNRSQWLNCKNSEIFLDAYNANPSSMLSAIDGFVEKVGIEENYCLILGDMYELGLKSEEYHMNLSKKLLEKGYKNFIFVGRYAGCYNSGCEDRGLEFLTSDALKDYFKNVILKKYKYVFIKGSRSLQLESLVDINKTL